MSNRRQFLGNLLKGLTGGALLPLAGGGAVSLTDPAAAAALPATLGPMQLSREALQLRELRRELHRLYMRPHSEARDMRWRALMTEHYRPTADAIASRPNPTWADCVELAEAIWQTLQKEHAYYRRRDGEVGYRETGALAVPLLHADGNLYSFIGHGFSNSAYWCAPQIVALVEAVLTLGKGERFDPSSDTGLAPQGVRSDIDPDEQVALRSEWSERYAAHKKEARNV